MISIILMLLYKAIVLAPITFLAGCYQVVKDSFTALRCGHYMVNFQGNAIFSSTPTILAGEIISTQNGKPNSQSSLFQMVVAFLAFAGTKSLPMAICYKWFATLKAVTTLFKPWVLQPPSSILGFIATLFGAIQATTASCKFLITYRTFDGSILMPLTIHRKYIIAQYTGVCK